MAADPPEESKDENLDPHEIAHEPCIIDGCQERATKPNSPFHYPDETERGIPSAETPMLCDNHFAELKAVGREACVEKYGLGS